MATFQPMLLRVGLRKYLLLRRPTSSDEFTKAAV
jgi:hypothetical protein